MTLKFAERLLLDKLGIIYRTDDDHWLIEPIHIALESMDKLETTEKELKKLRAENESLRNDIKVYEKLIESELGFGEGEEE